MWCTLPLLLPATSVTVAAISVSTAPARVAHCSCCISRDVLARLASRRTRCCCPCLYKRNLRDANLSTDEAAIAAAKDADVVVSAELKSARDVISASVVQLDVRLPDDDYADAVSRKLLARLQPMYDSMTAGSEAYSLPVWWKRDNMLPAGRDGDSAADDLNSRLNLSYEYDGNIVSSFFRCRCKQESIC